MAESDSREHAAGDSCRVEFSYTIDDLLDVTERSHLGSATYLRTIRRTVLFAGVAGASACYLFVKMNGVLWSVALSLLGGGFAAAAEYGLAVARRKWFLRALLLESAGGKGPFPCVVEIGEAGITVTQEGVTTTKAWSTVRKIVDTASGIEFISHNGSVLAVRNRAFASAQAREDFQALAWGFWMPNALVTFQRE